MSGSISELRVRLVPLKMFNPSSDLFADRSKGCVVCRSFFVMVQVCYDVLYPICSVAVTSWERTDILVQLCVIFSCVFVTFLYGVSGQVWYLIVLLPDLYLLLYFNILFCHEFKSINR